MKRYYVLYYFILFLLVGGAIFFWYNKNKFFSKEPTVAQKVVEKVDNVNEFASGLYHYFKDSFNNIGSERQFSKVFCQRIINSNIFDKKYLFSNGKIKMYFSASCSVWLYYFCKDVTPNEVQKFKIANFVKNNSLSNFPVGLDEIDRASAIFNQLANDYFNLKLLTLLADVTNFVDIDQAIKKFSDKYFGDGKQICGEGFYLDNQYRDPSSLNDKKAICGHPLTYRYLQQVFNQYKFLPNKIKLVNTNYNDVDCEFVKKAFSKIETESTNDMLNFYNLLMNEYFWYSLYMNFYKFLLNAKALGVYFTGQQDVGVNKPFSVADAEVVDRIRKADRYLILSWKAINQSIRLLNNIYWTFPIHVALMAYYEDLIYFRKYFVTIYTPFHQLYYKLRNVEDLDR